MKIPHGLKGVGWILGRFQAFPWDKMDNDTVTREELEKLSTEELVEEHEIHLRLQKSTTNSAYRKNHAEIRNAIYKILESRDKEHLILWRIKQIFAVALSTGD